MDLLGCPVCRFLMCEPVTLRCGHSFCRRCVGACPPSRCPGCKEKLRARDAKGVRNNVLLSGVVEKCCPEESKMKWHIQEKIKAGEFGEALQIVQEGLELAPDDLSLKLYRSEANAGLCRFAEALCDLDDLCCVRPGWPEGFFRKGKVLLEMGRHTEALTQFQRCLKLQADFSPAKAQIKMILEAEGMVVPDDVPQILQLVSEFLSGPCPVTSLMPSAQGDGIRCPTEEQRGAAEKTGAKVKSGTECCLSLCQAVSFLPTAEDDEELMMKKEERSSQGCYFVDQGASFNVLTVSDFECPLCIRLFYEPVTTPCGHTFCKNCLERSLDHNHRCPLCKQPLQEYFKSRKFHQTVLLQQIVSRLFPQQLAEREQLHTAEIAELSNLTQDIPIFVCTVAYPGIPCPLHVFEPRYRLMMRRCMEIGTKKFGMCCYESGKGFADYGCMLEILDLDLLPDGRSYVDTVGGKRFRVLRRGLRDGYNTADIEYLEDHKIDGAELEVLQRLHDSVYQQALEWYNRLNSRFQDQICRQYGTMPVREENIQASSNGPAWCWWLMSVLQLDPAYQTTLLSLTSLKDRLGHLRIVMEYFSQR
ncbi:LON peptidase N-terminal domain and RING finger protein 1-like [Denticeps clupeoides]|uniref:LON peptidase N-terminal domain and RING finger protein 1 n=1 Tax=Denticeps clupeoides TaxID=299321 RepID=A0AAY4E9E6_9TELE|nr:LON peptidase N-terminal domain and RING finger protein 1-like [Denticeps clupeoides]